MREVSQEEFDEFIRRRQEVLEVIKYGQVISKPPMRSEPEKPAEEIIEDDEFHHWMRSDTVVGFSDGQVGSKYLVHYEDLAGLDL